MDTKTKFALSGWIVAGVLFIMISSRGPAKIETHTVIQEVVKWKTHETIRTLAGATIYRDALGNTTITGPVVLDSTSEGSASKLTDSHTIVNSVRAGRAVMSIGVLLPHPVWQISLGIHAVGPFGVFASVIGKMDSYLPSRFGGGVMVMF